MSDADAGVEESVNAAARTALTVAMQMGEKFARLREEMAREAERRNSDAAKELSVRFEGERAVAKVQLDVVNKPEWWATATVQDVARVAETAAAWKDFEPSAAAASEVISQQVHNRYGLDVNDLVADERARASQDNGEAVHLMAEADRLDRAVNAPADVERTPEGGVDLITSLEAQARSYDADADRGGADGRTPDELRELAAGARNEAELYRDASTPTQAESTVGAGQQADANTARADAGNAYDSAERREEYASSMARAGAGQEEIAIRMRTSTNQARPIEDALNTPTRNTTRTPAAPGRSRTRQRDDRSR